MAPVASFKIALIADMDKDAVKTSKSWKSRICHGTLNYNPSCVTVEFSKEEVYEVESQYSYKGRGMELSDLLVFNNKLYTVGDKTGIVYEIADKDGGGKKMIPWVILSSGDGRQEKGFKGEWMTVHSGVMVIGGHGREFVNTDGSVENCDYMWVKYITPEGAVTHRNWSDKFSAMRNKAGYPFPGYLTHESAAWSVVHNSWFFLPRKANSKAYDDKTDEQMGTNLLLKCSEDFSHITVTNIGEVEKKKGYSSFKFIPDTDDQVILAIRSEEVDGKVKTHITAFTIDGKILMKDQLISDDCKYEGIEFVM